MMEDIMNKPTGSREDPELQARIDAASVYECQFVPAEFQEWAPRTLDAGRVTRDHRVLDVACGTGIVAREAALRVGPGGFVAGLDLDPGMLAVAARVAPGIAWRRGSAESLPYPDRSFDAVVCQFGLMFVPDRCRALHEMRRLLAPGGYAAVAVWDTLARTPAYATLVELLERIVGQTAADALRAPFALGDLNQLAALLADAGLSDATIATHQGRARFPSIRAMLEAELRGWMPAVGIVLDDRTVERIMREAEAEQCLGRYVTPDGDVQFDSPAHIVTFTSA
jgi:SAM-dependent methyltransferase